MIDTTNFDVVARLRELAEADLRELARDIPVMGLTIDADELRRWADAMDAAADELTRLRTLLSSSRGEQGWRDDIKAAPHGKKVIVRAKGDFQGERTMMARFYPKHTLEAPDGYGASDGFDEDEYGDVYAPEGWYEDMEAEEPPLHNIEPTHWMPLPSAPGSVPTSLAGQLPDAAKEEAAAAYFRSAVADGQAAILLADLATYDNVLRELGIQESHKHPVDEVRRVQRLAEAAQSQGVEAAAELIDRKVSDYTSEHGNLDPETGVMEFSRAGEEYVSTLEELAEEIRAINSAAPQPTAGGDAP